MAHHGSSEIPPEFLRGIPKGERFGATGRFPEGKLTPEDEGEIRIGITDFDGKVVMDFGTQTSWIGFTPEQADAIADTLHERANQARLR